MNNTNLKQIVESLIFASERPLTMEKLKEVLGTEDTARIEEAVNALKEEYRNTGRSFSVAEVAGGYQLATNSEYADWISRLYKKPVEKLSNPSMETLAIIAYKQPITRSEIEAIRGVNVDGVVKSLMERNLIKTRGRRESPGRPIIYGTTNEFLIRFGLKSLKELPTLKEFGEKDLEFEKAKERDKDGEIERPPQQD